MHDDFPDWPDRKEAHTRRADFIAREMERVRAAPGPDAALEAAQLLAQRDGLERVNEYFRQRETRTIAERLGLAGSIDTRIDYDI